MTNSNSSSNKVQRSMKAGTVLKNGLILTHPGVSQIEPNRFTAFEDHLICAVNSDSSYQTKPNNIIDCSGCLIIPGFVNCHNHSPMSLLRGLCDDLPLDKWLSEYIFPTEAKFVSPEFVHTGALLSMMEMLLSGTTTVADAYFFMEKSAEAALTAGIRTVACQGILDFPTPDCANPAAGTDRVNDFLENFPHSDITTPAIFCHSPYLCSKDTYLKSREIAQKNNLKMFSHVSETCAEIRKSLEESGLRPFERLADWGVMDNSFVAVHAVHLEEKELDLIQERSTNVVHCPRSNMKLSSGLAHVKRLFGRGVNVGLGTDGPASNNNLDMIEEMRNAAYVSKIVDSDSQFLSSDEALFIATEGGAKALGMEKVIGSLEVGKYADIIVVDLKAPHLYPNYHPSSSLVYSARGSDVRDVFVHGKHVVRDRKIQTFDTSGLLEKVNWMASEISRNSGIVFWGKC